MGELEQLTTITTLYIPRGEPLEIIFQKYGNTDKVKLIAIKYTSPSTSGHSILYQIGPARCKLQKGLSITSQTWYEKDIEDFIKNYDAYQDIAARRGGDGDVFDRGMCEKVYLLDKEKNWIAEFGLVPKKDRIYTPEYKQFGIRALNQKYQISLELTDTLYILDEKNKLKKEKKIPHGDFTRPQLENLLPAICSVVKIRTCNRVKTAIITEKELDCRFDGIIPI